MTILRKICTASVLAIALASVPMHLAAQEREAAPRAQTSVFGWFSNLWSDLTAWLADGKIPDPKSPPEGVVSTSDGGGCLDPNGRCGG